MKLADMRASTANPGAQKLFLLALAALTLIRLVMAVLLELHYDEAYYWFWAKNLQASYYDHPPMVAWLMAASTALIGDNHLGVRLFALLGAAFGSYLVFDATRRAYGERAALFAGLAMQASLLVGAGGLLMTPDAPLSFFSIAILWVLVRLSLDPEPHWWLLAGLLGGLALLSKYTAGLTAIAVLIWLLWSPDMRKWLARPWPWLAGVIAVITFSPVLFWNISHDWISFDKQGGRLDWTKGIRLDTPFEYIGGQALLVTPILFVLLLIGVWQLARRAFQTRAPLDTLLVMLFFFPALFFLTQSPFMRIQGNWPAAIWPPALLATAGYFFASNKRGLSQNTVYGALGLGFALTLLVYLHAALPTGVCWSKDPVFSLHGKRALTKEMVTLAQQQGLQQIVSPEYATAGWLRFYSHGLKAPPAVTHANLQPRYKGFGKANPAPEAPFLLVSKRHNVPAYIKAVAGKFGPTKTVFRSYKSCTKPYYATIASPTGSSRP